MELCRRNFCREPLNNKREITHDNIQAGTTTQKDKNH